MGVLELVLSLGSLLTLVLSVAAFLRQNKMDAADYATKIIKLEQDINNLKAKVEDVGINDLPHIKGDVNNLSEKVNKLSNDWENKIDKIDTKLMNLDEKVNKIYIILAKSGTDV